MYNYIDLNAYVNILQQKIQYKINRLLCLGGIYEQE